MLLDNTSNEAYVTGEKGVRWTDVHMSMLHFDDCVPASKPARQVCGIHAAVAISNAEHQGWIARGEISMPDDARGSEGYDSELMETFLGAL